MPEKKFYTYAIYDNQTPRADGTASTIDEEGGPATEEKIEELVSRHYAKPYFEEWEDGKIFIFRSKSEAGVIQNAIGEVKHVSEEKAH
jgi:hypothetical protein